MRQYRGKPKREELADKDGFVKGWYYEQDGESVIALDDGHDITVHPDTVGQSTGETVTNGEVFIGDKMADENDGYLGVVKFGKLPLSKSGDCVCTYPAYYIDCADSSYYEDCCEIGKWQKITGTIHPQTKKPDRT